MSVCVSVLLDKSPSQIQACYKTHIISVNLCVLNFKTRLFHALVLV